MFSGLPKFIFFTGKGGVGKTSLACATAVGFADNGEKVLLVSTDPASNIGQLLETGIGSRITAIDTVPRLEALEIDPEQAASAYRERIIAPLRGVRSAEEIKQVEEQLSGACTTEVAAFDEFTRLLTDSELIERYDHVIFDTAPTGHTIRLLQLPGAWSGFLEEGKGDASCLGPLAGLEQQRERYAAAVDRLADRATTTLVLVARPQHSALAEAARTSRELAALGIENQQLAINGLMPEEPGDDHLAKALAERDRAALAAMEPELARLPRETFVLRSENLVGIEALRRLAASEPDHPGTRAASTDQAPDDDLPGLDPLIDDIEQPGKGLIMFMGKGGVGKTTMAAAVAVELADRGHEVLLTTTDPAAHVGQALGGEVPGLTVSWIDPAEETANYREQVMKAKGKDLDPEARARLEEDLQSPCTEEIAVFQAFSRVLRRSARQFVVMDTAPTGHTLMLLDMTGSYHRDIMRHMSTSMQERAVTPMMRLQDPRQTKVLIVTLPETTPVLEAGGLQDDLRRAGVEPWAWIINASLAAAATTHPLLCRRAATEREQIDKVAREFAERYAVVAMQAEEPVGTDRLRGLGSAQE